LLSRDGFKGEENYMSINTCSGAISFLKSLENDSSAFYQHVAQKHEKDKDVFLTYAKENSNGSFS
jgi:hypothetical protein